MSNDTFIFDPIRRARKRAPTPDEIKRVRIDTLQNMASIGGANAISELVPMLGSFLWSERLPAAGPQFDAFIDDLRQMLRDQIATLSADAAARATPASAAWH
jgi:hypothetical protein